MPGPTAQIPAAIDAAAGRVSSMSFADVYGASDDTGPSSAVAGSLGYASVTEAAASSLTEGEHATGVAGLVELGHELIDSPAGLAFLLAGLLLLVLWRELAD